VALSFNQLVVPIINVVFFTYNIHNK